MDIFDPFLFEKQPCVYILSSDYNGTLYTGVTSVILNRMAEHLNGTFEGFTNRYKVHTLVYYEFHSSMTKAIQREKRLKKWKRNWKIRLIEQMNPEWQNLFDPNVGILEAGLGGQQFR